MKVIYSAEDQDHVPIKSRIQRSDIHWAENAKTAFICGERSGSDQEIYLTFQFSVEDPDSVLFALKNPDLMRKYVLRVLEFILSLCQTYVRIIVRY